MTDKVTIDIPNECSSSPFKDNRHEWYEVTRSYYYLSLYSHPEVRACKHCKLVVLMWVEPTQEALPSSIPAPLKGDRILFMMDGKDYRL